MEVEIETEACGVVECEMQLEWQFVDSTRDFVA